MKLLDALKDGSKVQYNGWDTDRYLQMEGNALFQYKDGERLSVSLFDFDLNSEKFDRMKAVSGNGLHPEKKSLSFVTEQKALAEMEEKRDETIKAIISESYVEKPIVVDPVIPDGWVRCVAGEPNSCTYLRYDKKSGKFCHISASAIARKWPTIGVKAVVIKPVNPDTVSEIPVVPKVQNNDLPNPPDGYRILRKGTKPQSTDMVWMPISKRWQLVGKHKYGEVKHTGTVVRPINAPDVEDTNTKKRISPKIHEDRRGTLAPIPDHITNIPDGYEQLPVGTPLLPTDKLATRKTWANGLTKWENIGARRNHSTVGGVSIVVRKKTEQPIIAPIPELDFQPAYGTWCWVFVSLFAHNEKARRRAFIGEDYYWQMDANRVVTDSDGAVIDTENNLHTKECDWELYKPAIKPEVRTVSGVKFAVDASITNATILKGFFKWATYVFTGRDAQADEYLLVLGTQIDQYLDAKTGVKQ